MESSVDGDISEIGLEKEESIISLGRSNVQSVTSCSLLVDLPPSKHKPEFEEMAGSSNDLGVALSKNSESLTSDKEHSNNNSREDTFEYNLSTHQVTTKDNVTEHDEAKLALEISEMVDAKKRGSLKNDESFSNEGLNIESSNTTESGPKLNSTSKILKENVESEEQVYDELGVDSSTNVESTESNDEDNNTTRLTVEERHNGTEQLLSATESAFQKLASLGVTAEEKPATEPSVTEEFGESALQKLASMGAISITGAGGFTLSSSISKTVTITPSQPKYIPEPRSATKTQQAKKIKIDPGKSMDIDKDFSSLISFLSTGAERDSDQPSDVDLSDNHVNSLDLPKVKGFDKSADVIIRNDCSKNIMDVDEVDVVEDESDSESHDGNKSVSQGSDHAEERDERVLITSHKQKNVIEEGSAEILLSATKNVFYNKVQEFNRDMSIVALTVFSEIHQQDPRTRNRGKKRKATEDISDNSEKVDDNVFEPGKKSAHGITILEALSATGLRSIRYAREIPGVKEITANDLSEDAVETIQKNIEHNAVEDMVTTTMSDASLLMYQQQTSQQWYDAIDLDPYGCPSRFLDSAVQAVRDGGMLLVTCTDMAVLAGNSPETCYVKYGAVSLRSPACHEMALRIALQCIESHANRYGRYIVPLVSFSADFYIRLIVQIYTSPVTCKRTTSKLSMVYQCVGCQTHSLQPLGHMSQPAINSQPKFCLPGGPPVDITCLHCNYKHIMGGPIWSAPIYSSKFVESMLRVVETGKFATAKRMQGMLEVIREELPDVPLYYTISGLCTRLHCQAIPLIDIRSAILNNGYKVSSSHAAPTAIKTNAPAKIIWDIMRCWVHMNPVAQKRLLSGSVAAAIILEPPTLIANFDIHPKARPSSNMRKLLRYQPNPEKNWGPGMRAKCNVSDDSASDKSKQNQNKNKSKSGNKHIDIIEVVTIDDEDDITEYTAAIETPASMSSVL